MNDRQGKMKVLKSEAVVRYSLLRQSAKKKFVVSDYRGAVVQCCVRIRITSAQKPCDYSNNLTLA